MDDKDIKVTGTRSFDSGAIRDPNESKGRYDLLSPMFISRLAKHTQKGGQVRGDRNWEAGMPMDAVLDSAIRHLFNYLEGDRSEDHLAAAAWNVMNLIHTEEQIERGNLPKSLSEGLPDYTQKQLSGEEVMDKLMKYGQYPYKVVPVEPEDMYPKEIDPYYNPEGTGNPYIPEVYPQPDLTPYDTAGPYEQWDCVPSTEVAEFYELERCCQNCVHRNKDGGPIPYSMKCANCVRVSNWSSSTEEPLGPEDLS